MPAVQEWHSEARSLREQGLSEREIAEAVGKAPSTVHDVVKDIEPGSPSEPIPGQRTIDGGEVSNGNGNGRDAILEQADRGEGETGLPPRPGEGPPAESVYVELIRVDGTTQVAIDFGGKRAQSASLSLSGKAEVDGFYRKGDVIRGTFEARITGVGGKDKLDKQTGIVVEASQSHSARITDLIVETG